MSVQFTNGQYVVAEVTCIRVVGSPTGSGGYAALGGDVIRTNMTTALDGLLMSFLDSGQPGGTGDQISNILSIPDAPPEDACPTPAASNPIDTGDITVIDE
jgi:hypothetical protein